MKISRTRFIAIFVISAFVFQFISNSVLGPEVRLFPGNGDWFAGSESNIVWKKNIANVMYPVRLVLTGPLSPLLDDPDPVPPILLIAFALYWSVIALVLHLVLTKIIPHKKNE